MALPGERAALQVLHSPLSTSDEKADAATKLRELDEVRRWNAASDRRYRERQARGDAEETLRALRERDRYRDALLKVGERVMTFGGFQRTPRGEFWVSRDDVIRVIDEELAAAASAPTQPDGDAA